MEESLIPNTSLHDVVSYDILIDDAVISRAYQILSLSISKEINRIPFVKIVLRDGEASEKTFAVSEEELFIPGKKIKIKIGRDGENNQAFAGIITKHAIRLKENGNGELIVECRDEAVKMTIGRNSKYYENVKDSEVFDQLISGYSGLSSDTEATTLKHKELVQHHISNWDFMLLRAEANGMLVSVEDGSIKVSKPDTSSEPVLQVTYGTSLLEFEAEMDARNQWKKVEAKSWDYANQNLITGDSESSNFTEPGNIPGSELANTINLESFKLRHSGHRLEQELRDWSSGMMMRSRLAKIRGRAKFSGFSAIKPGDLVKIEGVGKRFKGKAYVTAVRHDIGQGMWDTHIQFGLDPERYAESRPKAQDPLAGGLVSAISGLQIGKVAQLESDPDGENRILVKIPTIDNSSSGIWSRVATLDAGSDRGSFFLPELDDEVIVGFINDDPRDAVILGMLHSSAKAAPLTAKDDNHEKGFTTRSKMHILFNDDTKTITIDTPAGNSIILDETGKKIEIKDQNMNSITMDSSGIKIESPKNIEIKAGVNLTLSAAASLTIGGASLSVKADGNVSVEGAVAKLSSQGITEITGSLVKIN